MADTNGNGKAKARELVSIHIAPFDGAWDGKTTRTDKRFGDGAHKFTIKVPVPETDSDAQDIYGCSLFDIIEAGVIQKWYGARHLDNVIQENFEKGRTYNKTTKTWEITDESALVDPNAEETIDAVTKAAAEQSWEKVVRESKSKELKAIKAEVDSLGGIEEAKKLIAELKALKAQRG